MGSTEVIRGVGVVIFIQDKVNPREGKKIMMAHLFLAAVANSYCIPQTVLLS